jgi:hypothetical protein
MWGKCGHVWGKWVQYFVPDKFHLSEYPHHGKNIQVRMCVKCHFCQSEDVLDGARLPAFATDPGAVIR